jgi:hypothetical protein
MKQISHVSSLESSFSNRAQGDAVAEPREENERWEEGGGEADGVRGLETSCLRRRLRGLGGGDAEDRSRSLRVSAGDDGSITGGADRGGLSGAVYRSSPSSSDSVLLPSPACARASSDEYLAASPRILLTVTSTRGSGTVTRVLGAGAMGAG